MKENIKPHDIRNISIIGHHDTGKTTLMEAMLFLSGTIDKMGTIEAKNTVSDYEELEKKMGITLHNGVAYCESNDKKINLIDTPGLIDFAGDVMSALRVTEGAIILLDSVEGIEMETNRMSQYADQYCVSRILFVNKMDKEKANFSGVMEQIASHFQKPIAPVSIPMGEGENLEAIINIVEMKQIEIQGTKIIKHDIPESLLEQAQAMREKLIEAAMEGDDTLMEKYLEGDALSEEEIMPALARAVRENKVLPLLCGSALNVIGIHTLLNFITDFMPSPVDRGAAIARDLKSDKECECTANPDDPLCAFVFKTRVDQYAGRFSYIRVRSGRLTAETEVFNPVKGVNEKVGRLYQLVGQKSIDLQQITAGDIGAIGKLEKTKTGDTLCDINVHKKLPDLKLPRPVYSLAVSVENKNDEDRFSALLHRAAEQDPTIQISFNPETKQLLLSGMGDMQLDLILNDIQERSNIAIKRSLPRVAYRETITRPAEADYKHKKQSGGHGQFGEVKIKIEPMNRGEGFTFHDKIVGGVIPKQFIPGVEKGIKESMETGIMAKYPVTDIQATLFDGKFHAVDSSEMSFKIAGFHALRRAMEKAAPILLEPVMKVTVFADEDIVGDVMSDVNSRRGKVLGMEPQNPDDPHSPQIIRANIPQSELLNYVVELRSMTSGRAAFEMDFSHYEPISGRLADTVIESRKAELEEAK